MTKSVIFNNVTKKYKMYQNSSEKLKDLVFPDRYGEDFYALQNISFSCEKGDVVGIIGVNGSGKSTMSNLIAGIIPETSGTIFINGKASLIAIASGLNNQLTGRENIELKMLMLGFNKDEIKERISDIIEFADIGKFVDQPVKKYSSGMKSRLGFAISVNVDPDIIVIDEALSVGDKNFADKSFKKMNEFKEKGKTIFFVSHSIGQIKRFCEKILWLEAGEIRAYGSKEEIIPQYEKFLKDFKALSKEEQKNYKQLVIERRSKLRDSGIQNSESEKLPLRKSTRSVKKRKKKVIFNIIAVSILILLSIGIGFLYNQGSISNFIGNDAENNNVEDNKVQGIKKESDSLVVSDKTKEEGDIRYIDVSSANIRSEPNLNSEIVGLAEIGKKFKVIVTEYDEYSDVEWLYVSDFQTNQGWISSNLMTTIDTELDDVQLVDELDVILNTDIDISEAIQMVENQNINPDTDNGIYEDEELRGLIVEIEDSSVYDLINKVGNPQLFDANIILYHGELFDYKFSFLDNGQLEQVSVIKWN
ncbi:teichoic acids export ABC transporter ATP-binding subunit TagH [Oceanobacillus caeni]|uniref:teichoic acids export ABC transporter ATP-binding subunit TagH n=1 Tax=Oceanobacillus caeni TaxID=405946 RepID=UPI001956B65D